MDDDAMKLFKENLLLQTNQVDIKEADIEKTKPKNCGMVKEKVKCIESL